MTKRTTMFQLTPAHGWATVAAFIVVWLQHGPSPFPHHHAVHEHEQQWQSVRGSVPTSITAAAAAAAVIVPTSDDQHIMTVVL